MKKHLAIFKGEAGDLILTGKKIVESRFSKVKNPPFGVISSGDLVYIKPSGKDIIGEFRVKKVISFDGISPEDLTSIQEKYGKALATDKFYWLSKKNSRYGTLIFIGDCTRFITSPIRFKKTDLRGWVVLE
ncbi:ASCH domain-containing protein [Patescibacteria group bacterium]|nr:ASCH domain-containing protein [Patescibacteria group bacterium]